MAVTTKIESEILSLDDLIALDEVITDEERRVRDAIRRFLARHRLEPRPTGSAR